MAAFNLIRINTICPNCGNNTDIECQTHVASSFDGKGAIRFGNEVYHVGDVMNWYDVTHPLYSSWKQGNSKTPLHQNTDTECCYATCSLCNCACFVLVQFKACSILKIEGIGKIEDWPTTFYK